MLPIETVMDTINRHPHLRAILEQQHHLANNDPQLWLLTAQELDKWEGEFTMEEVAMASISIARRYMWNMN